MADLLQMQRLIRRHSIGQVLYMLFVEWLRSGRTGKPVVDRKIVDPISLRFDDSDTGRRHYVVNHRTSKYLCH